MRRFLTTTLALVFSVMFVSALSAQVAISLQDDDTFRDIRSGETLTFDSEGVGQIITKRLVISYDGDEDTSARIAEPSIAGSTTFSVSSTIPFPVFVPPGTSHEIRVSFSPTGGGPFSGQLNLPLTRTNLRQQDVDNSFRFNLSGRVPEYNLSFQLPGGNQTIVTNGGTIQFEETTVDTTMTANVTVTNRGSGPGTLETVTFDGREFFELGGLALLPRTIEADRDFTFQVRFTPPAVQAYSGSMSLGFGVGTSSLQIVGNGVAAVYSYELTTADGQTTSVPDSGTIAIGSTPVGEEIIASLTVTNSGTAEGTITNITITGDGYSLSDRPLIPAVLDVGDSFTMAINLTPIEPGMATGQLRIGDSTFDLTAEALGSLLTYTLIDADGPRQVDPRDTIVFPQTQIGGSSALTFEISNSGNEAETISGVGVGGTVFVLGSLPSLPAPLNAGQTISFTMSFEPDRLGPQNATLAVNAATFTLTGVGDEVPDLPRVSFSTSGGNVNAADAVPISLSIAEAFPVDIEGTLSLTFDTSAFANDPTIQFSTGGRTARFRIAKGSTEAIFPGNVSTNPFLTGTVAGTITLSATFETEAGGVDITPDTVPEVSFAVGKAQPSLLRVVLGNTGQGGFSLQVTGFATSRTVSELQITFAGIPGSNVTTPSLTADVASVFGTYYGGNQSAGFGSQFTATVNFTVNDGSFEDLSSVSITAANENGQSNSVNLTLN